ncbi:MAG: glycosyltransferase [Chloroflexi bacterium]|nr:glycosyltransferase [Chloroflexota bacterium]
MRVLFLSRWFPYPADNGAKLRIYNLLRQLARVHDVTLLTCAEQLDHIDDDALAHLRSVCADVRVVAYRRFQPRSGKALAGIFSSEPRYLVDTHRPEFSRQLHELLATTSFDVVLASQLSMVPYGIETAQATGVPVVLEELEIALFRDAASGWQRPLQTLRHQLTWIKLRAYLRRVLPLFAACTVVSEPERQYVAALAPEYRPAMVIPNGVDLGQYAHLRETPVPGALIFPGALTYSANLSGADWFLREVFVKLKTLAPDCRLNITGQTAGVDLNQLPQMDGYTITGYVPDIRPVIARSMVTVVPLLVGGGTRLKILESLAIGTPVVSTSKGAQGLDVRDGEHLLIADTADAFAASVQALLQDTDLRARLVASGRRLVRERYSWDAIGPRLCDLLEQVARPAVAAGVH